MTKPAVVYPDAAPILRARLTELLADETCTVAIGVPKDWTLDSPLHVQVAGDGTPRMVHPIVAYETVRFTVRGRDPGPVWDLASMAMGLLLAEPMVKPLTGVLPTRDPQTGAELATFTVRRSTRSQPVPTGS